MPVSERIDRIFGTLESAGYPRALQRQLLPEWVTSEVLSDNAASTEIAAILAQRLGLRSNPLFSAEPRIESLKSYKTRYKRSVPAKSKNLSPITSIAVTVAEMVSFAFGHPYRPLETDIASLRKTIFEQHGGKWIGLRNTLLTCWDHGIPVIHLSNLDDSISKMDAMVVFANNRPNIILTKNSTSWAWQLFILAHEMGHCALGHVNSEEILIDEQLGDGSYALTDPDKEEQLADHFAIALLNGRDHATYTAPSENINAIELSMAAIAHGLKNRIDPGHIVLNYGHHNNAWVIANKAVSYLEKDNEPANKIINELIWANIDRNLLPDDNVEFLEHLMGTSEQGV